MDEVTQTDNADKYQLFARLRALIDMGQIDQALVMHEMMAEEQARLKTLQQLAEMIARELRANRALDLALELPPVLKLANDLVSALESAAGMERAREFASELAGNFDLAHDRARELGIDLAFDLGLEKAIWRTLFIIRALGGKIPERTTRIKDATRQPMTLTGIETLTAAALTREIGPFLAAVVALQRIISEIKGESFETPRILLISQTSAIQIVLQADIAEAIKVIREIITPWRHKKAKQLAKVKRRTEALQAQQLEYRSTILRRQAQRPQREPEAETPPEAEKRDIAPDKEQAAFERAQKALRGDALRAARKILRKLGIKATDERWIDYQIRLVRDVINPIGSSQIGIEQPPTSPESPDEQT